LPQRVDFATKVGVDTFPFAGQVEVGGNVVAVPNEVGLVGQHIFQALLFAHDRLGFLGIRPEVGVGSPLFDLGQTLAQIARVKDTPEVRELYLSGLHILFQVLQP
jgi:hypothetical protein